jgi:hypothetical protein
MHRAVYSYATKVHPHVIPWILIPYPMTFCSSPPPPPPQPSRCFSSSVPYHHNLPSALKREHPALQTWNFLIFSTFVGHFALLDPDPVTQLNPAFHFSGRLISLDAYYYYYMQLLWAELLIEQLFVIFSFAVLNS